jgi:thiamine-phosphate pyrophosphorylase
VTAGARLLLIADGSAGHVEALRAALGVLPRGGVLVQVRAPGLPARALLERVHAVQGACLRTGAPVLVNDRADVLLASGASGLHLPAAGLPCAEARRLVGPERLLGVSCHGVAEVAAAAAAGADYALFSPIFAVPGKGPPQGLSGLSAAARSAAIPVFALGGVDPSNALACLEAGARGVACIRSVLGAPDPAAAARALWQALAA